jgi:hypothetical protein
VEVDAPLLVVDTSAVYSPSLDEIIEFVQRSAAAQAHSTPTRTDKDGHLRMLLEDESGCLGELIGC